MVGAITTLIVVVAVFLAYNANNGLPFVPTYQVSVEIPNASRLVRNNEVRIGGSRVGVVQAISPVVKESEGSAGEGGEDGDESQVVARLDLTLDKAVAPLPEDSVFQVRYRSSFGLKYLDITRGDGPDAEEGFLFVGTDDNDDPNDDDELILSLDEVNANQGAENGTFVEQTEFDDIGNTFDQETRNAGRANLVGYGNAFAGRGASLNLAIEALNPLLSNLKPVVDTLLAQGTRFDRLFPELGDAARIVAPVAEEQGEMFTNLAITFEALSADTEALKETISEGPETLETGIRVLPGQANFLNEFADLSIALRPGVGELRAALPDLNTAIEIGTPVLNRSPEATEELEGVFASLEDLVEQPETKSSLVRLERTFDVAKPLAEYVTPAQTVCNYWNYWFTLLPEHLTERDSVGYTQRVSLIATPPGELTIDAGGTPVTIPGEVETGISSGGYSGLQANGKQGTFPNPASAGEFDPHEFPILHGNPSSPTGQNGSDCQPGQQGYVLGDLRVPGQAKSNPAVALPDLPGDRGATTAYWLQDGTRILKDTRVESRQP